MSLHLAHKMQGDFLNHFFGNKCASYRPSNTVMLEKLDEVFQKDTLMENYRKMKDPFRIERETSEKNERFCSWALYEKAESECREKRI